MTFCRKKTIDRGYRQDDICDKISKIFDRNREDILTQNNEPKYRILLTFTYSRTLPNVNEAVKKQWNILKINNTFKDLFPEPPIMCFHRNKHLKDFLWTKTIVNNKVQEVKLPNRKGYSTPCHSKTGNVCCNQAKLTDKFSSRVTRKKYNIYNKLGCKSSYLIYLMECTLHKRYKNKLRKKNTRANSFMIT